MLRPVNDIGGLLIAEGIENALACHASGLGLWAAGSAGRLPALADKVPDYVEADHNKMTAKFLRTPKLADVPYASQMHPHLIVEFYSR